MKLRSYHILGIALAAIALISVVCKRNDAPWAFSATRAEAEDDALAFTKRVAGREPESLGFASRAEALQAKLGLPLPIFTVSRDRLSKYDPAKDKPEDLLTEKLQFFYPVLNGATIVTCVYVEKNGKSWYSTGPCGRGRPYSLVKLRQKLAQEIGLQIGLSERDFFLVRIPELDREYIAFRDSKTLYLGLTQFDHDLKIDPALTPAADWLFRRLQPLAQKSDDRKAAP